MKGLWRMEHRESWKGNSGLSRCSRCWTACID